MSLQKQTYSSFSQIQYNSCISKLSLVIRSYQMCWELLGAALFSLTAYLLYVCIIAPVKVKGLYAKRLRQRGIRVLELPHRPHTAPVYANMFNMFRQKKDSHYQFKHTYKNYDVVISNVLNRPQIFVVNNPKLMMEALSAQKIQMMNKACQGFQMFKHMGEQGIVMIQGQQWKHRRKIISKVFNFDFISSFIPSMLNIAEKTFNQLEERYWNESSQKYQFSLYHMMTTFTSNIVITGFIGFEAMKEKVKGKTLVQAMLELAQLGLRLSQDPLVLLLGPAFCLKGFRKIDRKFINLQKDSNQVLQAYVNQERKKIVEKKNHEGQHKNMVSELLKESENAKNNEILKELSNKDLIDDIKTFVAAGTQTTSNFLTTMLLLTYQHPQVLSKLISQINLVIHSDADISIENFKKLKYLDCVIHETSRYSGGMLFERQFIQDTTLFGIPVFKGTNVGMTWVPMFFDQQHFENPLEFMPERWQKEQNQEKVAIVSLFFSGGPRSCIGKYLALAQIKVMVIKFLQRYQEVEEPGKDNREFQQQVSYHLVNSDIKITKKAQHIA